MASLIKNLPANAEDVGLIPGSGRFPGEGNGNPFQYSCLGNPMDRGAWQTTVHGVARVRHDLVTKPPVETWLKKPTLWKAIVFRDGGHILSRYPQTIYYTVGNQQFLPRCGTDN